MESNEDLLLRILELESRLERYHIQLEAALELEREAQTNAVFGSLSTLYGWGGFVGVLWLASRVELGSWLWTAFSFVAALFALGAVSHWIDRDRDKFLTRMPQIPSWDDILGRR